MRIGIPAIQSYDIVGVRVDLLKFASLFGDAVPIFLDDPEKVDAIFLPGGSDVNPARYNQLPGYWTYKPDPYLEYFDMAVLPKYLGKIPVVGICRGLQSLNVIYGGTLYQHGYGMPHSSPDRELVHRVKTQSGIFSVNSYHHQGIKKLGTGLKALALDAKNRIEAISDEANKVFAVQWHPERMVDENGLYYDSWSISKIKELLK